MLSSKKCCRLSFLDEIFECIQLAKKLWCVCRERVLATYTNIHLSVVKYNCVIKLSCLAKSLNVHIHVCMCALCVCVCVCVCVCACVWVCV